MATKLPTYFERLNILPAPEAESELLKCCGSREWARRMVEERPFISFEQLIETAERIWCSLGSQDWLEAFNSHPKIGETKAAAATALEAQKWSALEQSGVKNSGDDTIKELAELNHAYEEKFGFIFILCASGKSSEEMLSVLRARLVNDRDEELRNAAAEQVKITELRLRKLMSGAGPA